MGRRTRKGTLIIDQIWQIEFMAYFGNRYNIIVKNILKWVVALLIWVKFAS